MKVALLTGGGSEHYQYGLTKGLVEAGVVVDFIGNDSMSKSDVVKLPGVNFLNLRGDQDPNKPLFVKVLRILKYYWKLISYVISTDVNLLHIQWDNKFFIFDRTILILFYKIIGKKIVFTAHNIDSQVRAGTNSFIDRMSEHIRYKLVDHIIVHTNIMKEQLVKWFNISSQKVSVIPHGILDSVPRTSLRRSDARLTLRIAETEKVLLFFGMIDRYKGVDILLRAFSILLKRDRNYKLLIVGSSKIGKSYLDELRLLASELLIEDHCLFNFQFVPDEKIEMYLKAADCLVLPYRNIFQSGVLFLAFSFGIPVIASDVGNFREDVLEGNCGYVFLPNDENELAKTIEKFFRSSIFTNLELTQRRIQEYAKNKYSWTRIGVLTQQIYCKFI